MRKWFWLPLLLVAPLAGACGDQRPAGEQERSPGGWQAQVLDAESGVDYAPLLVTDGNDAMVITVGDDGELLSHLSSDGAELRRGEPLDLDFSYVEIGGAVRLPDGDWLALVSGERRTADDDRRASYDVLALRSSDGLSWETATPTGFEHPVDISDLVVVDGQVVAAGSYRLARDPGMGGFEAHVWSSADGLSFDEVDLPGVRTPRGYRRESSAADLALAGDRVVLAGRTDDEGAIWSSDDAGTTWRRVDDPALDEVWSFSGLVTAGDLLVAGTSSGPVGSFYSDDGGDTWRPSKGQPVDPEAESWTPIWSDRDRVWSLTGIDDMTWDAPEVCYADLAQCGEGPPPRPIVSTDAQTWSPVDLDGEVETIVGTDDGRVLALDVTTDGVRVRTLPAGAELPIADAPVEPERVELTEPPEDAPPEVGVRYHLPLYLHCGISTIAGGGQTWQRTDDGPDVETGAGDTGEEGWPIVGQMLYGYATLTSPDELEYSLEDGTVIATYARGGRSYGCD